MPAVFQARCWVLGYDSEEDVVGLWLVESTRRVAELDGTCRRGTLA